MVEQGTHKPLVGGSIPPLATSFLAADKSSINKKPAQLDRQVFDSNIALIQAPAFKRDGKDVKQP